MAKFKSANPFLKSNNDTGFGNNPNSYGGRFINKDGTFNLRREGISIFDKFSVYQRMLSLPTWKFGLLILAYYFSINVLFTLAYILLAGNGQLQGMIGATPWATLKETFFFSTQTFVTVSFGRVYPVGDMASIVTSIQSLAGYLSFAIITGLVYGRFSRPRSYLAFSDFALIAPYRDKTALMFRFVNFKDNHILTNVEIKLNVALKLEENGEPTYKFYDLALERTKVDNLPMNWTVVHAIDENSPLFGYTPADYANADMELYVLITGFDEIFSNPVLRRTSYTYNELRFDVKFAPMYRESEDGKMTILELHKLNSVVKIG